MEHRKILLRGLIEGHDTIADAHREGLRDSVFQSNLFRAELDLLENVPPGHPVPGTEDAISRLETALSFTRDRADAVTAITTASTVSTSGSAAFADSDYLSDDDFINSLPGENRITYRESLKDYYQVLHSGDRRENVEKLIGKLGLDSRMSFNGEERMSVAENFRTACEAYEKPVYQTEEDDSPAQTILLPLRSAIDDAIERLYQRRPKNTPLDKPPNQDTQKAKIISIGEQLRYDSVPIPTIREIAEDWPKRVKKKLLTRSKGDPITEEEMRNRFLKVLLFFETFLSAIDPTKLR